MNESIQPIKGAVYFPARAYNAYQTYLGFSEEEVRRDFGYAQAAGINGLRIFTSYEYWREAPAAFWQKFEQLLCAAADTGIGVMPILFENCGREPSPQNALDRSPLPAACIQSPGRTITGNPALWQPPLDYMREFMARYKSDSRLLAIECMNEPNENSGDLPFARRVTQEAHSLKGSVPLTIGCIHLHHNLYFSSWVDVYQFHDNFPTSVEALQQKLKEAACLQQVMQKPVWLSEWQRARTSGPGWDKAVIPTEDTVPLLCSLAPAVYGSGLGSFFWSLMIKPAYLPAQRPNGTFNGLFHEDGRVYSAADYEAVAQNGSAPAALPQPPHWYLQVLNAL